MISLLIIVANEGAWRRETENLDGNKACEANVLVLFFSFFKLYVNETPALVGSHDECVGTLCSQASLKGC